ncbi:hypothetical protein HYH02_005339 [Chlamydomonas schloesseri]|uniref:Uncharacterized protein n=1 Tax=Chlamydomonas schloesseri TaxID=2026947 RepID=A0A835WLV1_9CHLO|nr:hypothetical protein HYH02_005339 [Chlamydomonas schloesseri]|eukprot:KAG2449816.1 hypothetical protein HYH02_005339 [Chlamydomonas schloesseri]
MFADPDRLRCCLVCSGWRHAFRSGVAAVSANLEAVPRAAQRQLAALEALYPAATKCRLVFPKFLLPPPDPHGLGPSRSYYRAPLLGSPPAAPDPDACNATHGGCGGGGSGGRGSHVRRSGANGSAAAGAVAGRDAGGDVGQLRAVTELELDLGLAGYTVLMLQNYVQLPALASLTIRGFSPAAAHAAQVAMATAAGPGGGGGGEGSGGSGRQQGGQQAFLPFPVLGLGGFPQLQALTLSGTLSYRDIFAVPRVTSLRSLTLEGRAVVGHSEGFIYLAALRRLSSLSRLQHLALLGPVFMCAGGGGGGGGGQAAADAGGVLAAAYDDEDDPEQLALARVHPRHDGAAAVGGLVAALTRLTSLHLATLAPVLARGQEEEEGAVGGGAGAANLVPCSWARLSLDGFTGLQELSLRQPGHLPSSFWSGLAALRQHAAGASALAAAGGGRTDGAVGVGGGVGGGSWQLRALSLDVGSSGIVDELPCGALEGMTRLHLSGVQLDALSVLTTGAAARGCRGCLTDLVLELPAEGYLDPGRGHNVATLAALGALTRLELRTAPPKGGGDGGGGGGGGGAGGARVDGAGGGAAGGEGRGGGGGGGAGARLLLNDSRLQALTRGLRRLASLSFRGSLPLGEDGVRGLGRSLSALTRLELVNDGGGPASLGLHLLPQGLQELSLYCVGLGLQAAPQSSAAAPAGGAVAVEASAAPPGLAQQQQQLLLPRCRVLHLDYCSGAPVWRVLAAMMGTAAVASADSGNARGGGGSRSEGTSRMSGSPPAAAGCYAGRGASEASAVVEELRLQVSNASGLSVADAAAVAALPRLHKLQVSCGSGVLPDFILARMLTPAATAGANGDGGGGGGGSPGQLTCLSLRLPGSRLALGQLQALRRLGGLRSLYLDMLPPAEVALLDAELRHLTGLRALTLGPVYGRGCSLQPQVLPALGRLQAALRTCRLQQAASG